jgi:hypothetical protein
MNTKILGAVVAAIIVAGAAWYFMNGNTLPSPFASTGQQATTTISTSSSTSPTGTNPSGTTVSGTGTISGSGTIAGLLAQKKNQQCSITLSTGGSQTEGVIYLSAAGKMRGDFSTSEDGNAVNSTTINDGVYVYSWSNLSTQGYKTTVAASGGTSAAANGGVDNSAQIRFSCKPWTLVSSKFTPPSNIKF